MITLPSGRRISPISDPFVIAEVGSNFRDRQDCIDAIVMAKNVGADAAKFQLYTYRSLYGFDGEAKGVLDPAWLPAMREKADAVGIELMCSAFSPDEYSVVNDYVTLHKVASAEATHVRILERLRSFGKHVVLSTGAKGLRDIEEALKIIGQRGNVLMYCVAAYPAQEINLDVIELLDNTFESLVGYSDHSTDVGVIPRAACMAGATVLEKHFTAIPEHHTPDRDHSLEPSQFRRMVDSLRGKTEAKIGPAIGEQGMVLRHNRRLIAIRTIAAGELFKEGENFGIYRSLKDDTRALSPFAINQVNGRTAKFAILAGDGIAPSDLS